MYDSISLSSHILRRNIGSFKIKRNPPNHVNATAKSRSRSSQSNVGNNAFESQPLEEKAIPQQTDLNEKDDYFNRERKSLSSNTKPGPHRIIKNPSIAFLSQNSTERDRLYFELNNFETSSKQRQIEERLESLITEQLEANRLQLMAEQRHHLSSEETALRHPTWFGALLGDGLVLDNGIRRFDFLLLDWRPREKCLTAILETLDTSYKYFQVRLNSKAVIFIQNVLFLSFS